MWHRIYAPADGLTCPPEVILDSTVYMREAFLYIDGKEVYTSDSQEIHAHVSDPVENNTICCDQTVAGLSTITDYTVIGFVACGSSVATNFYLFDANFNPKAMSYTQNYCNQFC